MRKPPPLHGSAWAHLASTGSVSIDSCWGGELHTIAYTYAYLPCPPAPLCADDQVIAGGLPQSQMTRV